MKRKFRRWMVFVILLLLMTAHHTAFVIIRDVFPFSDTFGRGTSFGRTTSAEPVTVFADGSIAYWEQAQIQWVTWDEKLHPQTVKQMPLPDSSASQATQRQILKQGLAWIANQQLYLSLLQGDHWGPVYALGESVAFAVAEQENRLILVTSDDLQVRMATLTGNRMSDWQSLRIQDVTHIQVSSQPNGHLYIASLADYGANGKSIWWTEWDPERKQVIAQSKIHSFQVENTRRIESFQLGVEATRAYIFHADRTEGQDDSRLFVTDFPLDAPNRTEAREVHGSADGQPAAGIWGKRTADLRAPWPAVRSDGGLDVAVTAGGQVRLLRFQDGKQTAAIRVTNGRTSGYAPVAVESGNGREQTVLWLERKGKGAYEILASGNQPDYREQTNRLRASDWLGAIGQVINGEAGVILALAASLKWLLLPYLYLAAARFWKKGKTLPNEWFQARIAGLLYLAVKMMLIGQFYSEELLSMMPSWMSWGGSRYLLTLSAGAIAFGLSGLTSAGGRSRESGNSQTSGALLWQSRFGGPFTGFALLDIGMTAWWYGFFIG